MKIGIIGAGRVGTSLGKYLSMHQIHIVGYYDAQKDSAEDSAKFTNTDCFSDLEELVNQSDTLFITTGDDCIAGVWDCMKEMSIKEKIICHFSGSLSSDVFSGIEETGATCCSIHPMLAFSSKYSSYSQLNHAFLTIEGKESAVTSMKNLFTSIGNQVCFIKASDKVKYHLAASLLSNHVIGIMDLGYSLLQQAGFTREEAREATKNLVINNIQNVCQQGVIKGLTGPIERGDVKTVEKHLQELQGEDLLLYKLLGHRLLHISEEKHPDCDYGNLEKILHFDDKENI